MRHTRLLLLALTLLLALPPGLVGVHQAVDPRVPATPGFAAPQQVEPAGNEPGLDARKRGDRKAKRREARKERKERKERREDRRERKSGSQTSEQARIEALVAEAPPRIPALAVEDDPCGPGLIQLPKSGRCTHGPDPEPPAAVRDAARSLKAETPAALCEDGDGTSGFRVQVLYLRAANAPDRYDASLATIREESQGANTILRNSQPGAQDLLNYHFVRTAACDIDVADVAISQQALLDFDSTIQALEQRGYDRVDRIYLMFADTSAAGICGIGTYWPDDRKTTANYNNRGPSYSRADIGCWDAHTAAHELMHNLGGVQDSAPNSSRGGHCIDEYDVMCYSDYPYYPVMKYSCGDRLTYENLYDCGNNDYFNPAPPPGNYLASHWNTADNWFLTQDYPIGVDLTPPEVTWVAPVGNGQTHIASSAAVPLQANATDASGIDRVQFWLYDAARDDWVLLGEDASAPYIGSVNASQLRGSYNYITADAFDAQGNWADEGIWIQRTSTGSGVDTTATISLVTSTARVKAKKRVTLTAAVANVPAGGASVEFRFCRGSSCTWAAGQSLGTFSGAAPTTSWKASGKGRVTFLAQVTTADGTATSNQTTVSVKKVRKKKR